MQVILWGAKMTIETKAMGFGTSKRNRVLMEYCHNDSKDLGEN